jgi:hypothetical protein
MLDFQAFSERDGLLGNRNIPRDRIFGLNIIDKRPSEWTKLAPQNA